MNDFEDLSQSPPPPAYSEQEFDQKISLASELSQATHQHQVQHEDTWEVWDDAAFQEAANKLNNLSIRGSDQPQTAGSSSANNQSSGSGGKEDIQPLRIHKKNLSGGSSSTPSGKPRPSWLVEVEGNTPGAPNCSASMGPVVPAYTPTAPSESIPSALSPTALPNRNANQEWRDTSPDPGLTGRYRDQRGRPTELPPLTDNSFPPPPFLPNAGNQLPDPYTILDVQPELTFTPIAQDPVPFPGARPTSMPAQSNQYGTNMGAYNQQLTSVTLQRDGPGASCSVPTRLRHSMPTNIPGGYPQYNNNVQSNPYSPSSGRPAANTCRSSMLPPRVNVDLSTVYGKRPVVTIVNEPQPQQAFDAAAFYNSAVSAHLGSTYSRQPANSFEQAHQSRQPLASASLCNLQQTTQLVPNRYSYLPPGSAPPQNPYSFPMLQNPLIRSPTPTYPAGTANPAPQILAVAGEGHYGLQHTIPHPMTQGRVDYMEPYNPYR